jgi:hypothetical protein
MTDEQKMQLMVSYISQQREAAMNEVARLQVEILALQSELRRLTAENPPAEKQ